MANIVLVHGAWHGAWCYSDLAKILRDKGHNVIACSLSGVGERAHQLSEGITLETHVRDVKGYIDTFELNDVVLLGHSYGGMVITALADRIPNKIKHLVYLDAFVPKHGQSLMDLIRQALPPEPRDFFLGFFYSAALTNNANTLAPVPAEAFGIAPENCAKVNRLCTQQPLATFEMPALLTGAGAHLPKHYILADKWDPSPFRHFAAKYAGQPGWTHSKIACGHDIMVDAPQELAAELEKLA